MMFFYHLIVFNHRRVYLLGVFSDVGIDHSRVHKPGRIGEMSIGNKVDNTCFECKFNVIKVTHKEAAQVLIKLVEFDNIFKSSPLLKLMGMLSIL